MLDAPDDCTGMRSEFIRKVAPMRFLLRAFLFIHCYGSKTLTILVGSWRRLSGKFDLYVQEEEILSTVLLAIAKSTHSFPINHLFSKL